MSQQGEMRQRGEHTRHQGSEGTEQVKQQATATAKDFQHQAGTLLHEGQAQAQRLKTTIQQNPRLQTGMLLLSAFCLGIALTLLMGKMGYGPASPPYRFKDAQSLQAHEALDVLLGNAYEAKSKGKEKAKEVADQLTDKSDLLKSTMRDRLTEGVRSIKNKFLGKEEHEMTMGEKLSHHASNLKDKLTGKQEDTSMRGRLNHAEQKLKDLLHGVL